MEGKKRKEITGVVISDKMNKTRILKYESYAKDKHYHKIVKKVKKYVFHDENNMSKIGDKVIIVESRPRSATKRWELVKIISSNNN